MFMPNNRSASLAKTNKSSKDSANRLRCAGCWTPGYRSRHPGPLGRSTGTSCEQHAAHDAAHDPAHLQYLVKQCVCDPAGKLEAVSCVVWISFIIHLSACVAATSEWGRGMAGRRPRWTRTTAAVPSLGPRHAFFLCFGVCWHAPLSSFGRLWHRAADRMPDEQDWPSDPAQKSKAMRTWSARMCYDGWVGHCTQNTLGNTLGNTLALLASEH